MDAPRTINWNVWNQVGIGFQNCPYILYNFYNTTSLKIQGHTVEGTVYAPFAAIIKTVNQSNIEVQIIDKPLVHMGKEMHYAVFQPSLSGCASVNGVSPIADFSLNPTAQCLAANEFTFTNTSNTGAATQLEAPLSYLGDFGGETQALL